MRSPEDTLYCIALKNVPQVGPLIAKNLISYCGSPEAVFREKKRRLLKIPGVGQTIATNILDKQHIESAEREMAYVVKHKVQVLFYLDEDFPNRLKHIDQSPILLYARGNMNLNAQRTVAIVGTRRPTEHGKSACASLIQDLRDVSPLILSGLAYGIDITAHREALKCDLATVAVLGSGLGMVYPAQHHNSARQMERNGGLLTEFSHDTKPDRENFPARNRIVAGLADVTLVVESAATGGSMITAEFASAFNREIGAVPGRVSDPLSMGCNNLIKQHKAHLITNGEDVARLMGWNTTESKSSIQRQIFAELSEDEELLVELMPDSNEYEIDDLTVRSKLRPSQLATVLLSLEFKGVLRALPGNRYVRV